LGSLGRAGGGGRDNPPAYAYQYSTVGAAQQQAFPGARFEEIQPQRVWKALAGGRVAGYFFVGHVIGKHLYIDYSVALNADGSVRRVEILTYRESYGFEVANAGWLRNSSARATAALSKSIRTFATSRAPPCRRGT
jgi:hypothetical protein